MTRRNQIILASKSPYRAQLLKSAGVEFTVEPAQLDERAIEAPLLESDLDAADVALVLAQAKAMNVSENNQQEIVIGSDQTLSFENQLLHKPENMEEARRRLLALSGKSHQLHSALAIAKAGDIVWHFSHTATIKFRHLSPEYVGRHLAQVGDVALTSVGAYQIEGLGINLFESIEGDFFSIIGLPLLPLLTQLREMDIIDG